MTLTFRFRFEVSGSEKSGSVFSEDGLRHFGDGGLGIGIEWHSLAPLGDDLARQRIATVGIVGRCGRVLLASVVASAGVALLPQLGA